jgi:hypothetical protein
MARWTCPSCDREFARAKQSHVCVPGGTVDETFAGRPAYQRQAYDAIIAHIATLGPVHVDAVGVGVFLKSDRKFAEIRPMARALSVDILAPFAVAHRLVLRSQRVAADRVWSVIRLRSVDDVDDDLRAVLTAAYDDATS